MKRRNLLAMGATLGLGLPAGLFGAVSCISSSSTTTDVRINIIRSWAELVIMPAYATFVEQAKALQAAVGPFCQAPSSASLQSCQTAWSSARQQWKRMEALNFGPSFEFPERYGPKIDFWPARTDTVEETLSGDGALTVDTVASFPATARGLPVLEYLLFGEESQQPLELFTASTRRCDYLNALSQDLIALAQALHDAWASTAGDFVGQLTDPGDGGMYMSVQEAMSELVNRMWFTVENIRRDKLGRPLGNETDGEPQPTSVESLFSGRSTEDVVDNLAMLEALFEGGDGGLGLVSHARIIGTAGLIARFRDTLTSCRDALAALTQPLATAVLQQPNEVQHAIDVLADLQRVIQVDIIAALSLNIAFNDSDGD